MLGVTAVVGGCFAVAPLAANLTGPTYLLYLLSCVAAAAAFWLELWRIPPHRAGTALVVPPADAESTALAGPLPSTHPGAS